MQGRFIEEVAPKTYTFADIYHAAKTEEHFDYVFWIDILIIVIWESFLKLIGKGLVCIAVLLITFFATSGFLVILPQVARPFSIAFYLNAIWG